MTAVERAKVNLGQVQRWQPSSDFDRRMKALNLRQLTAYLAKR